MSNRIAALGEENIRNKIYTIRGLQVMIDSDLADLYGVLTKNLNKAVKRNIERFPEDFMFQLTMKEFENMKFHFGTPTDNSLRFQNGTLKKERGKHRKYYPYAFTEQGVAMLSGVLRSDTAVKVSIQIMSAFVAMRKFLLTNAQLFQRMDRTEQKLIEHDNKFEQVFNLIEGKELKPKKGIFFNGQIFDAYLFVANVIRSAKKSIILIDNFIDDSTLMLFAKRKKTCWRD
jgi:phage regulator Rha-like protein